MATIYRFIVEGGGSGRGTAKSGTGSAKSKGVKKHRVPKEKATTGVEFNRYQRITTTLGNKMTNQLYSPALRTGKAVVGTISGFASGGVPILAIMIIVQTALRLVNEHLQSLTKIAQMENSADMKKLQVGKTQISKNAEISYNMLTSRIKINEND